jgi:putative membrane protein
VLIAGLVLAALAAALHVYIWWLESFAWTSRTARAVVGTTAEEAEATRSLAQQQGFYNLFLALMVLLGILLEALGRETAGRTLVLAGTGAMLAAAVVLVALSPAHKQAGAKQGLLPLLAVGLIGLALA